MDSRISDRADGEQLSHVKIEEYSPEEREAFKKLNYEWIREYFSIEAQDRVLLSDPEAHIIEKGGAVFFARVNGNIVGTCALIRHDAHTYELAKMAVTPRAQGRQVGKKLALSALERAKEMGAHQVILETNSKLGRAVALYTKLGFKAYEPSQPSKYGRTDLFMKLELP